MIFYIRGIKYCIEKSFVEQMFVWYLGKIMGNNKCINILIILHKTINIHTLYNKPLNGHISDCLIR